MKYLIALVIVIAAVWGFSYMNKEKKWEDTKTITGTETSTATEVANSKTPVTETKPAETTVKTEVKVTPSAPAETKPSAKTVAISYTDAGFSPTTVTINKGDSVTFTNNSNSSMWVASGPHPVHTNYPEFDQKTGVTKGQSYTFKFEKAGTWGFHNHQNPSKFGSVIVK